MAYLVSQLRKDSTTHYMEKLDIDVTDYLSKDPFGQTGRFFRDYAICRSSEEESDTVLKFEKDITYYIRFKIARIPQYYYSSKTSNGKYNTNYSQADTLNLSLILCDTEQEGNQGDKEVTQTIGTCSIPMITSDSQPSYSVFSFVFTPIDSFRYLVFQIQRSTYDAIENSIDGNDGRGGRTWLIDSDDLASIDDEPELVERDSSPSDIEDIKTLKVPYKRIFLDYNENDSLEEILKKGQVCELKNILNSSQSLEWLKLGYQSRPGNLIIINGEPIRVGRSGIFELNNGITINSFMIAAPGGAKEGAAAIDAFLLDYAYQKKKGE